ncbi:hypothetical protein SLS57_007770 [Botryosphaeria dothidea]
MLAIKVTTSSLTPGILSLLRTGAARTPTTIGHECAGTIHALGSPSLPFRPGTRVRLHPVLACQACHNCARRRGADNLCASASMIGFARFEAGALA